MNQYPIQEEGKLQEGNAMIKAQSYSKPVLPLLNISKVKDDRQNILAIRGFHEATRNPISKSPHLSVGLSRGDATGEFNISVGDPEGSLIKGDSSRREEEPANLKLRGIANKLGENNFLQNLPAMVNDLNNEKFYETFASNKGFLNTQDIFKLRNSGTQKM